MSLWHSDITLNETVTLEQCWTGGGSRQGHMHPKMVDDCTLNLCLCILPMLLNNWYFVGSTLFCLFFGFKQSTSLKLSESESFPAVLQHLWCFCMLFVTNTQSTRTVAMPQVDLAKHSGHEVTTKHWPISLMSKMQLCSTWGLHSSRVLSDAPWYWTAWV